MTPAAATMMEMPISVIRDSGLLLSPSPRKANVLSEPAVPVPGYMGACYHPAKGTLHYT